MDLKTDLRPSSLRVSIPSGLRLSARVFFLISLAVCLFPRLCSTCRKQTQLIIYKLWLSCKAILSEGTRNDVHSTCSIQWLYSDLGQEPSKVSPHVGEHFLLLGLIICPLLGLFILFPLSLLLWKSSPADYCSFRYLNCSFIVCGVKILQTERIIDMRGLNNICNTMLNINHRNPCLSVPLFFSPHTLLLGSFCPAALL